MTKQEECCITPMQTTKYTIWEHLHLPVQRLLSSELQQAAIGFEGAP